MAVLYRVLICFALLGWLAANGGPLARAQTAVPTTLDVPLFPDFDMFGNQFEVVQAYENPLAANPNNNKSITSGLYDTGASLISFSWADQFFLFGAFGYPTIPVIPGAVATADAIGGTLTGQVSVANKVYAAGGSAITIDFNSPTFVTYDLSGAVAVEGVQAMVGTESGSPNLPSIVGTPINVPSSTNPAGLATVLDQTGYEIDLSSLDPAFAGIPFQMPDVRFVAPGSAATNMVATASTFERVTIPLSLVGPTGTPVNDLTVAPNPIQNNTAVTKTLEGGPTITVADQKFLFDTGAQLSIISPTIAAQLGLTDLAGNPIVTPFDTIDVQGAGEAIMGLPGYVLDSLTLPRTDGGFVNFTDVPVYVLDVGFGIDGILGMNLFNGADSFMYDPYNVDGAQLSVLFLNDRTLDLVELEAGLFNNPENAGSIQEILSTLGSRYSASPVFLPGFQIVPEPSTLSMGLMGLIALATWLRRRKS